MDTKLCSTCKQTKPVTDFYQSKGVLYARCKVCHKKGVDAYLLKNKEAHAQRVNSWRDRNPEKADQIRKAWYQKNRERLLQKYHENKEYWSEHRKKYHAKNKEKYKLHYQQNKALYAEKSKAWREKNKQKVRERSYRNIQKLVRATPSWSDLENIRKIYDEAERLKNLGHDVHVDHIVPIKAKEACGLHVSWNLMIVKAQDNLSKGNKMEELTPFHLDP
jgi:hypothetical protein